MKRSEGAEGTAITSLCWHRCHRALITFFIMGWLLQTIGPISTLLLAWLFLLLSALLATGSRQVLRAGREL